MKEGWEYKKLGDIGTFIRGGNFSKKDFVEDGFPCIHYGQIHMKFGVETLRSISSVPAEMVKNDRCAKKGDLVIAITSEDDAGSCKCTAWMGDYDVYVGGHTAIYRHTMQPKYVSYYFMSPYFQKDKLEYTHGFKVVEISPKDIAKISIPVPPLSEQQSIVDYLDSAFAKIDAMKANAEKRLNEAKALFQASLKEMLEPKEGWEEKRIDEVCSIARGGSPRPIKDFITNSPEGLNWIKIGDTDMGGKYIYSTKEKIKPEGLKKSRWVEVDEFLLSNSMSFGRPYILKTNGCIHDGWLVLRDYQKYLNIDFFYYVLSSENVQRQFRIKAQGSTVSNLNTDRVASVIIYVPTFERQQSIVETLDSLKSKVDRLQANYDKISQECDALKQAILRKVFE